ncbi:peptidoglycan DD-metalloendopeptidase family protein, partial [Candidatus Peregrinibacteria bacterium]|nr:peptidoglycan DD-metalloendopeptidase family protein [Candidatus Peregrinibacteria bacterium]
REIFEKLESLVEEQEYDQKILEVKKVNLILMHQKLSDEKKELEVKKQAKLDLLEQTKGQQSLYEELLERSKMQQQDVLMQIDTLRKNLAFVQKRMKELGKDFNPDDFKGLLETGDNKKLLDMLLSGSNEEFQPFWPVNPARGVSAYYHESSYVKVFGMQHNAIDIRAYQNTPIRAPADGIVYKAKDNGYGYSYIILAHSGGFMTLYGHVTEILVKEGEAVQTGDVIGLSGATPGTKGAGLYTTGPHLHFEVFKDGVHVDPLDYLSLAYLPLDTIPEKYLAKALGDRQKVRRLPAKVRVKNNEVSATAASPTSEEINN